MSDAIAAKKAVESLLEKLSRSFAAASGGSTQAPLLALHFGSTARGIIKPITDIDLFLVFSDLPNGRFERQGLFAPFEAAVTPELEALRLAGYHLDFSPHIVAREALNSFHGLYLDFPEEARVLYDPQQLGVTLLERVRRVRLRHGMRVETVAGHRVWNCRGNLAPGVPFDPEF
jgi:hypothetical protein